MLNYNLNINSPLQQEKKNEDVRPPINWDFHSFASASDSTDLSERTFATMSINAISTNCIQVSIDSGNSFVTNAQSDVTASITGSNWAITGSTTMSLFTFGITYDPASVNQFYSSSVSASGTQIIANPSISGSIITNKFVAAEFYRYYVSGSIVHMKGNVFNPLVKVLATGSAPNIWSDYSGSNTTLNIVKNVNLPISMSIGPITSSFNTQFQYQYCFGITASLTGSAAWTTNDSFVYTTMSLSIPENNVNAVSFLTASIITASFLANTDTTYTITASVDVKYIPKIESNLLIVGAGGGGATGVPQINQFTGNLRSGGGGGGGAYYSSSIIVLPNTLYTVVVGTSGSGGSIVTASNGTNGQTSSFFGFNENSDTPINVIAGGGFGGQYGDGIIGGYGGNSGNLKINTLLISSSKLGAPGGSPQGGGGGGASFIENGLSGSSTSGGTGALAIYNTILPNPDYSFGGGGGGGAKTPSDTRGVPNPDTGSVSGGFGGGAGGTQSGTPGGSYGGGGGGGASANFGGGYGAGGAGSNGIILLRHLGSGSLFTTTNASSSWDGTFTTYQFLPGSGSLIYNFIPIGNP